VFGYGKIAYVRGIQGKNSFHADSVGGDLSDGESFTFPTAADPNYNTLESLKPFFFVFLNNFVGNFYGVANVKDGFVLP